jgi:hypothetical protein
MQSGLTSTLCSAAAAAAARYGRMAASDKEIEEVADAACIHDPITTRFPKVCSRAISSSSSNDAGNNSRETITGSYTPSVIASCLHDSARHHVADNAC